MPKSTKERRRLGAYHKLHIGMHTASKNNLIPFFFAAFACAACHVLGGEGEERKEEEAMPPTLFRANTRKI